MATPQPPKQQVKDTVKGKHQNPMMSTQLHLKIAEIHDNTVILKNGGLRAVLKTSSVNLHLKSEEEQNAVIFSYQHFLNSLEFPLQIVIRSKKLDLDNYIAKLRKIEAKQENRLLKEQTVEYIEYIQKLIEYADIMEKEFFVIIPQNPYRIGENPNFFKTMLENFNSKDTVAKIKQRKNEFDQLQKQLNQRINIIKTGLENCGLHVDVLNTQQLIELFYETYNPLTARSQKIENINKINVELDSDSKPNLNAAMT
ncbi:MAG: hypothetical protein ACD_51C00351G0005 [uncultured bacterium]|nr:MAG: hypothetical protein ACD_51C00351G0005 [uncultured bacterium]